MCKLKNGHCSRGGSWTSPTRLVRFGLVKNAYRLAGCVWDIYAKGVGASRMHYAFDFFMIYWANLVGDCPTGMMCFFAHLPSRRTSGRCCLQFKCDSSRGAGIFAVGKGQHTISQNKYSAILSPIVKGLQRSLKNWLTQFLNLSLTTHIFGTLNLDNHVFFFILEISWKKP